MRYLRALHSWWTLRLAAFALRDVVPRPVASPDAAPLLVSPWLRGLVVVVLLGATLMGLVLIEMTVSRECPAPYGCVAPIENPADMPIVQSRTAPLPDAYERERRE